ncbi:Rrf2 family transcriptional regulator [Panacibacter ginsenosidivorans]|uniref:Rrf2 family transcriptional regulator n=1 Tax=Panacibacter ginsenosidivorans TaxID=1813871 RepID=A0A5B8VD63_9BACT|nr:Rrf2 family transcriptional regulator [Panacibacter ginsenosidivorans]QEC69209.1 Rrf2 family transcriptional regulator [Panacibacter ginsenosidivorans]
MLSYTCKTAIKAAVYLASKFESGENAGIKEIAEYINASEHTVGKLMQTLVKQGVVNSVKGPSGGFYISKEQTKQPIINIVEAIDGKNVFKECGLGLSKCSASHPCPIHNEYKEARNLIEQLFNTRRIADLCEFVNSGLAYLMG